MPIRYVDEVNPAKLRGVALLRLDFNAEDDWRMRAALPTVRLLMRHARAVLVLSHRGRPKGRDPKLSLRRDAVHLSRLIGASVRFAQNMASARRMLAAGGIVVLENLRFEKGEEKNDPVFAKRLAALGDYYVNDAFPVSHRANASVAAVTRFLPSHGGLSLKEELRNLSRVMRRPRRPLVMIFGGAKISDKLGIFIRFRRAADRFLVGGALANTLLALRGMDMRESLVEKKLPKKVRAILGYRNVLVPEDVVWHGRRAFDIGGRSIRLFSKEIAKARTIVWNGPMGVFENRSYAKGTKAVGAAIAKNRKAFSLAGGGETVTALKKFGFDKRLSFVSTGGGAMLEFLSGKKLPGIVALEKNRK
ncbi:MAG: phosphoglycerate kinase [Candidatus Liptonbacteria bacterium RIFCSPLOWO2_12_FULL_60_15]|uniref:Phosphoglycerate kinase n=3 Tax=Candidatus Liptoniibacteriota TaxID=1817909 RepID=A0A1G2CLH9_9BACT|nr:MAG: phosphoglycerate kinase [Candidatus Liptonbacteria bacterium RIFCSPLOWO2_12_FULL_60_15]